jgi:hypothetical protein
MIIKASGCSALILATGFLVGFAAGPSQATPASADNAAANARSENVAGAPVALNRYAKHTARHGKTYAHRSSSREALQSSTDDKAAANGADDSDNSSAAPVIPQSVANANAQLPSGDTPTRDAAQAMSARAYDLLQNAPDNSADARPAPGTQVVSADQLNDVDRALQSASAAPTQTTAAAEPPAPPVVANSSGESSTWDQTSLIGRIFIGFGALLTMASAARMFMA